MNHGFIRTLSSGFLISLFLFLRGGEGPDRQLQPGLTLTQVRKIIDCVSGERALQDIRHLTLWHRWFNSEGYDQAADYILGKVKEIGLSRAGIEKFPSDGKVYYSTDRSVPRWNVRQAELAMVAPVKKHIISWDEMPTALATNSRSADVEAELIDVGEGVQPADYEGKDVKGKFVLASSPQGRGRIELVHRLAVLDRGAAGVISYRSYYLDDFPDLVTWDHIFTLEKEGRSSTFGFCVSKRLGWELRRLLRSGDRVILRARVESSLGPGEYRVIEASIPGEGSANQEVWFIAHLDHANPGANDNASGSAAILESARAFAELIKSGILPRPRRTLRFFWVPEVNGTYAYLSTHPEEAKKAVAVINMDMVGEDQKLCGSTFQVTQTPDSCPSFINDLLTAQLGFLLAHPPQPQGTFADPLAVVSPSGTREPWLARVIPYSGGSDHEVFLGGGVNVPATMFGSWPDYFYHTAQDTPDKCDPTQLRRAIALAMTVAWSVANADRESCLGLSEAILPHCLQRIGNDLARAIHLLQESSLGGEDLKEALNILDQGLKREEGVLNSLLSLLPGENDLESATGQKIRTLRFQAEKSKEFLRSTYNGLCSRRGIKPGPPALTPEEAKADRLIPRRNPGFPGPFAEEYLAEKLDGKAKDALRRLSELAVFEIGAFIDGRRSLLEVRNAVSAESGPVRLAEVVDYVRGLESAGLISLTDKSR